jgi:hypothetical protein
MGVCTGWAKDWFSQAQAGGLPTGNIPSVGSIAVFKIGHVAYVEKVYDDDRFQVSEMGYESWNCVRYKDVNRSSYNGLIGFIFPSTVGRYPDGTHEGDGVHPDSHLFLSAYLVAGGYAQLGAPWNNGKTEFVHCWPDNCSDKNALWVQDFKRDSDNKWSQLVYYPGVNKVFAVKGKILEKWNSAWGYNDFGPPCQLETKPQKPWNGYSDWLVQGFTDKTSGSCSGRYIAYSPSGQLYKVSSRVASDGELPGDLKIAMASSIASSQNATTGDIDPGVGLGGGGGLDIYGNPMIPIPGVPCVNWQNISRVDWDAGKYENGRLFNGRAEVCGAFGWQGYGSAGGIGMGCNQGDDTRGPTNCVITISASNLQGNPFPVHSAQLTNQGSFPLDIEAGEVYLLSFMAKGSVPEQLEVALTPRAAYDNYNPNLGPLANLLAPSYKLSIATEWRSYAVHFLVTRTDPNAALRFFGGAETGKISLDDIKLELVEPAVNLNPNLVISRGADGQITATLVWAEVNGYLAGLTGTAVTRYDIATVELEQLDGTGYGVDRQSFDPYGNTLYLPSTRDQKQVWFYLVDRAGERHYLNLNSWAYSGATKFRFYGIDALDYGQTLPGYQPPQLTLSNNQIGVSYQTDASGNLVGFYGGLIKPSEACMLVVYLHGQWNEYIRMPFNQNGNSFLLNRQFSFDHFSFALTKEGDTTGHLYWLDPGQYRLNQPLRIDQGWVRWKWTY